MESKQIELVEEAPKDQNGNLSGHCRTYVKNEDGTKGQIVLEGVFIDGVPEGYLRTHHPNGELKSETFFKNGKRFGISREFDSNGFLINEEYFNQNGQSYMSISLKDNKTKFLPIDEKVVHNFLLQHARDARKAIN